MADITLTDSAHSSYLVQELVALRSAGELFDYVIKGTKESFHFHSLVLALVSPVFRAMLRSAMSEAAKKEATFPSIPDNIMVKIIDYAYNGTCSFSRDHLMDLIKAAHYLQMSKLQKMCEDQIQTVLQPTDCISWLQQANKLHLTGIIPTVQKMMQTSYYEISSTIGFKKLEKLELLQYLTDVRKHGTCSDDLLNGALEWIKYDAHNRLEHMEDVLSVVQIGKCSDTFLSKMLDDNAELFDKKQAMYKVMLSEVVREPKCTLLGEVETIIIMGGQSESDGPNTACWILQNDEMVNFSDIKGDATLNSGQSACQIPGGVMLTGGTRSTSCLIFALALKMWVKEQSLKVVRYDHASCYSNGKVFLIGGRIGGWMSDARTSSVDFMDLEKKTWCSGPSVPIAKTLLKVISFKSSMFVLYSKECNFYCLDEEKMSWLTKAPIPSESYGASLAASDDKIFAAGGEHNINNMYTPATDVWCRLTGPSLQERHGALVHHQQKLYLFPGCKRDENLIDVEEYDISTGRWSLSKWKMPTPLWLHGAFLVDVPKWAKMSLLLRNKWTWCCFVDCVFFCVYDIIMCCFSLKFTRCFVSLFVNRCVWQILNICHLIEPAFQEQIAQSCDS